MLALDLFNTPFERALNEGAVDDLEARRIHHLNTRMLELMSRANDADFKASPAGLAGLKREYQKLKDERDSYYKVREAGIPGSVPVEKIPGKEDLLKGRGRTYYEATGDDKFDAMMGKISKDPWTQLNSDPNWLYEIEELVDQQIEPWLLAMEKGGMPITRDEETLNPGWRKRYEQVANKLAQEFLTSRGLNPRDPDLVGKIRYAIDDLTDQSKNVHGQLSAYSDLPLARYAGDFDADGMTANIRDAMVGFIRTDDDNDDDEPPTRPMPDNDPRRLDPGNIEEDDDWMTRNRRFQDQATQDRLDHEEEMQAREFERGQRRRERMAGSSAAGVDIERWLKPYQLLLKNDFEPVKTKDRFEYLLQVALKLKGTNAGFSGDTGMSNAARIYGLQFDEQKLVANLVRSAPKTSQLEQYMRDSLAEDAQDSKSWMTQTRTKYPTAKFMQAKMPGAPIRAYVNGKVVAEFNTDQKKNSALGEKKLGQLRPKLGTGRDIGKSVKKFRAQRGLDEKDTGPLDQKLQRLKVQARRQFPRAHTDDEALVLKLLDKETQDNRENRRVDARQDAELAKNFALDREQDDDIDRLQAGSGMQEHGGGIGPKQRWQDLMPEQMNPEDYEDEDEDEDLRLRSGDYVRDRQDGESGEIFRMQGDPYERRVRILDRDGRGWYIEPSRLTRVDPQDPDVQRYFGKQRVRDMDEGKADYNFDADDLKRLERIRDLPTLKTQALALISRPSAKPMKPEKVEWFKNALDRMNSPIKVIKLMYDLLLSGEGHAVVGSKSSMNPNSYRQRFGEQGVAEGWSDAMVSRRTGGPRTPYAVYIKGKKWKDFENEDLAQAVANKLRAKFKADGRDPETVTIAPTDVSEGLKSTLAGAALAGAMALGGAGAAQAQSASGGSSMPNATTIIQQIQAGKIQNQNDLSAALGDNQSNRRFVFKQLQAKAGLPGHGADSVIDALAKKSTAGAQQPVKSAGQSGSIVQRPTDNFESRVKEDQDSSGVERAILNRIMVAHTDLLMKFGPDKVMQAAEEVAYNVGDVDEIGTSDVSAYVAQVKQILGATA